MNNKQIFGIITATILVFVFSQQVYAEELIQAFNMTEHEAKNHNPCYYTASICHMQKANKMLEELETEIYWNEINEKYYYSELDKLEKELQRLD